MRKNYNADPFSGCVLGIRWLYVRVTVYDYFHGMLENKSTA